MKRLKLSRTELFIQSIISTFGKTKGQQILEGLKARRLTSIRINTLQPTQNIAQRLEKQGISLTRVPWSSEAYVTEAATRTLTNTTEYTEGHFYIQSLSSMIPVLTLNPSQNESVLDMAAAPGSKTTQLAAQMKNTGSIVANDISSTRLQKLKAVLELQHVTNVRITSIPGQRIWQTYPEYFDHVLLDAPCSMEGRIKLGIDEELTHWSMKKVRELSYVQKMLLRSAVSSTKVGGSIVYSTCTINIEENEAVIDWILKKFGDSLTLEPITIPHLPLSHGIVPDNKQFDPRIIETARLYPDAKWEGFYIAKIRKLASTLP